MNQPILSLTIGSVLALSLLTALAENKKLDPSKLPPVSNRQGLTYAADIKSIFEKSCIKCHGPERQKNKLRLDSLPAALKGGDNGVDIVAGQSGKSPLVYAIAHIGEDEDAFMPPPEHMSHVPPLT